MSDLIFAFYLTALSVIVVGILSTAISLLRSWRTRRANLVVDALTRGKAAGGWLVQYRTEQGWFPCMAAMNGEYAGIALFMRSEDAYDYLRHRVEQNKVESRANRRRYRVTSAVVEAC